MKTLLRHWLSSLSFSGRRTAQPLPFDRLFQHFRAVLESKNRALEIIAEMGETLGGDYLFDITYVRRAYAELQAALTASVERFDRLTQGRYAVIGEIAGRIDRQVRLVIDEPGHAEGGPVIFHQDMGGDMTWAVGGKNARLAELGNEAGAPVPQGFAITTAAFDEFLLHNNLGSRVHALGGGSVSEDAVRELYAAISEAEVPKSLQEELEKALVKIRGSNGSRIFLAVRSSAAEEDGEFSFAGQFETVLNVLPGLVPVLVAYKQVVASLFSLKSIEYHRKAGIDIRSAKMAVCCLVMVDAAVSGVAYSADPAGTDAVLVNAAWGLGSAIVEGQLDADLYVVGKGADLRITERKTGNKTHRVVGGGAGGLITEEVPPALARTPSLSDEQVLALARQALSIEEYYRQPCDIEWAIDQAGALFILQARPLRVISQSDFRGQEKVSLFQPSQPPLLQDRGVVVQRGAAAGRVFILKNKEELGRVPRGAVLVARNDSSEFIRALTQAAAIITDTGTPTSHMASLCREFRVPTLVGARDASKLLQHGQEVTVHFDEDGHAAVYAGIDTALAAAGDDTRRMDDIYEFRKKRYLLRYITPLNLIDPLMDNFTPSGCRTLHDVLRFIHEKSVAELVDKARYGSDMLRKHAAVKLDLPVPAGIIVIDIGGGLHEAGSRGSASLEQIASVPLRAIVRGMTYPGIWRSDAVALRATDFLSSMMRMSDITADAGDYVGYNIAVASKEYVNLSLRFGYHLSMIDCYCSEDTKNNHIYFRFSGGATDITKRSRRIQLIADILKESGFTITVRGDLLIGRLANVPREDMVKILDQTGRLISYTRQLDALLHDDAAIARYSGNFMAGNYEI